MNAVISVRPVGEYKLELVFQDGARGEVDIKGLIAEFTGVFKRLEDPEFFGSVRVNPEIGTIEWPNGADICPDVLYSSATGKPLPGGEENWAMPA